MSVYKEFSATLVGISGEQDRSCNLTTEQQYHQVAKLSPAPPPCVTNLAASISEISFALPQVKLPFIIHCTSCFPPNQFSKGPE